jgi:hypothetical protein
VHVGPTWLQAWAWLWIWVCCKIIFLSHKIFFVTLNLDLDFSLWNFFFKPSPLFYPTHKKKNLISFFFFKTLSTWIDLSAQKSHDLNKKIFIFNFDLWRVIKAINRNSISILFLKFTIKRGWRRVFGVN